MATLLVDVEVRHIGRSLSTATYVIFPLRCLRQGCGEQAELGFGMAADQRRALYLSEITSRNNPAHPGRDRAFQEWEMATLHPSCRVAVSYRGYSNGRSV